MLPLPQTNSDINIHVILAELLLVFAATRLVPNCGIFTNSGVGAFLTQRGDQLGRGGLDTGVYSRP
jgi:hypothetical protein